MQCGLVSITFRKLSPREIIAACISNHIDTIEWGGDVHVPHGDISTAKEVGRFTRQAGLSVLSYGSYYRLGRSREEGLSFETVLDTASALGAPFIRVWPGAIGSADASASYRAAIETEALEIADLAAARHLRIAYEFHSQTLTDTTASALDLLEKTRHPSIGTIWQPYICQNSETCLESLHAVRPFVNYAHVFHRLPDGRTRRPLADGENDWQQYLAALPDSTLMIEFVADDSLEQFAADAATLRLWTARS